MRASHPADEQERLARLRDYRVLDTDTEDAYDEITRLAASLCGTPIAAISLIDAERQWFKSVLGRIAKELPRDIALCGHTILQNNLLIIPDTLCDARFADNPLVTGEPHLRFYAGAPLLTPQGQVLGSLCVMDVEPRVLTTAQKTVLQTLARQAMDRLELRRLIAEQERATDAVRRNAERLNEAQRIAQMGSWEFDIATGCLHWSEEMFRQLGFDPTQGEPPLDVLLTHFHPNDAPLFAEVSERVRQDGLRREMDLRVLRPDGTVRWWHGVGEGVRDDSGRLVRLIGTGTDVTAQRHAQERTDQLLAVGSALGTALTIAQVADVILEAVHSIFQADMGIVVLLSEDGTLLRTVGIAGAASEVVDAWREFPADAPAPLADAVRERRLILLSPDEARDAYPHLEEERTRVSAGEVVAIPLQVGARCLGALGLICTPERCRDKEQQTFLWTLAAQCALALERARLHDEMRRESDERRQAQEELRESEQRYRSLVDATSQIVWTNTPDGQMHGRNPEWAAFTGQTEAEYQGHGWTQAVHPDDVTPTIDAWSRSVAAGTPFAFEHRLRRHDGVYRTFAIRAIPIHEDDSRVREWVGVHTDITERRQTEERLRQSEEQFRRMIDVSPIPYALNDDQGNITFLNAEFVQTFGYTLDDIPTLADWWPRAYPDPEYRRWVATTWQARLETARRDGSAFEPLELLIRRKDGTGRTVLASVAGLEESSGGVHVVILYDITDRKRIEEEQQQHLREAQERADRDPLTDLLNHRVFHKKLEEEATRATRENTKLAVVMMDLDNFKFFNDAYGHIVGDEVLRQVAARLRTFCGPADTLARFGGDEFALLLPNVGDETRPQIEARLRAKIDGLTYHPEEQATAIPITICLGIALYPSGSLDRHEVVGRADERLRRAKTSGTDENEADQVRTSMLNSLAGFSMLDALVSAVDNKDRYTRRHSEDVMAYSLQIARELGFSEEDQHMVAVAALLHDVGKIGVPDAILRKPSRLTDAEFRAVQQHPQMGAIMVSAVSGLEDTLDAVRHHHERWDGEGYPFGLAGEETPLIARLMAVADAFSAMTTDRPYRRGMDRVRALGILEEGAGTQWDPQCVRAFVQAQQGQEQ